MYRVLGLFTCHNRRNKTQICLESLLQDTRIQWRFVGVNDGSTDGTKELLEAIEEVTVVPGDGNLYYSGGMRLAIQTAKDQIQQNKYDFVLLLNDDVIFHPGAISRLIDDLGDEQAIMAGVTADQNGEYTYGGILRRSKWRPKFRHVMSENEKIKCDTFNANCVLIPIAIFMELDNIDNTYVHGLGDYDYGFSASRKGVTIYASNFFVGLCEFDHDKKNTWEDPQLSRKKRLQLKETSLGHPGKIWFYFLKKNYSLFTAVLYTINDYMKILLGR